MFDCAEITTPAQDEVGHWRPEVLPGGRHVLFAAWTGSFDSAQIAVVPIDGGEHQTLGIAGSYPRYVQTGHLIFARENSLWGVGFDPETLEVAGNPVPLMEDLQVENSGAAQFDVSNTGALIYVPGGGSTGMQEMHWLDREGRATPVGAPPGAYYDPAVSPDGKSIAVTRADASLDIHVWDTEWERLNRVTFQDTDEIAPLWSPDGAEIAYFVPGGQLAAYLRAADGRGEARLLVQGGVPWSWTPDGALLHTRSGASAAESLARRSHRTGAGSRTSRRLPDSTRSSSAPSPMSKADCGRSRPSSDSSRGGPAPVASCTSGATASRSTLVVDPSEEVLQREFEGVERTFIPLHSIVRVDQVAKRGSAAIHTPTGDKVVAMPTPVYTPPPKRS